MGHIESVGHKTLGPVVAQCCVFSQVCIKHGLFEFVLDEANVIT